MSESVEKHRHAAPDHVRVAILTISDTRTPETDTGGDIIQELMQGAGQQIHQRRAQPGRVVLDDGAAGDLMPRLAH